MTETHLGGRLEDVPGFPAGEAMADDVGGYWLNRMSPPRRRRYDAEESEEFQPERRFNEGDRWTRVRDTARPPWRCICYLYVKFTDGGELSGTGWFSSSDTVITAGHNLYNPKT
ncbi:MAG: hypothetical protein AAFZ09_15290, partial [Pseudomonadota bacterium]